MNRLRLSSALVKGIWFDSDDYHYVKILNNNLPLYEINEGKIDKLLLLLIIDPLVFISRMRGKINGSAYKIKKVFNMIEERINCIVHESIIKYFLIRQLECVGVVNDVLFLVIDYWICCEMDKKLE